MKRKRYMVILATVLLLVSCSVRADEPDVNATNSPPVSGLPLPSSPISPDTPPEPPTTPESPPEPPPMTTPPRVQNPPTISPGDAQHLNTPYLVRLEPYIDGSYTDGMNTFVFLDDGVVLFNLFGTGRVERLRKKDVENRPNMREISETDEFRSASLVFTSYIGDDDFSLNSPVTSFIYMDGDHYYFSYTPTGGGSGEAYYHADEALFVRVSTDGAVVDYGQIRAAHIVWSDGFFYYVELPDRVYGTPGIGKVMRMDIDGLNTVTIIDEITYGPFHITGGRIHYTSLDDGKAYSVTVEGGDKQPVGSRIAPDCHRVRLWFYGDFVISDFWYKHGYSSGMFMFPDDSLTGPAIMDINGNALLTFPEELTGTDGYEVINWYDAHDNSGGSGSPFLLLKSARTGSYWIYLRWPPWTLFPEALEFARDQYADYIG